MYPTFSDVSQAQQFFNDIFDNLFGAPINFLQRYPEITDYQQIIDSKHLAQTLSNSCIASDNQQITNILSEIDSDLAKRIKKVLKQKLTTINKMMVQRVLFSRTGNVLVGFNWNINLVVSHSNSMNCNIPMCSVQLIIKQKSNPQLKRIVLQLDKNQLSSLIQKLKTIDRQLK